MSAIAWVVALTAVSGVGGTGLGGVVGAVFGRGSSRTVGLLLSFAGGVMLSVVCFDLVLEALFPAAGGDVSVFLVTAFILAGYGAVWLLNRLIAPAPGRGPGVSGFAARTRAGRRRAGGQGIKTSGAGPSRRLVYPGASREGGARQLFAAGLVMAIAIALHNLPEGVVIGAACAGEAAGAAMDGAGLVMAVIIGLHDVPEGMAVAVPLIAGGMGRPGAVLVTALTGATTVLGAAAGFYLGGISPRWLSFSMGFASGAMLYVVLGELLPEAILMCRSELPALAMLAGILTGLVIIYV